MKYCKSFLLLNILLLTLVTFVTQASALLIIDPDTTSIFDKGPKLSINPDNSTKQIISYIETTYSINEIYKAELEGESGVLNGSYDTNINWSIGSGGTIAWNSGTPTATDAYLLVKDGKNDPFWYLFNLSDTGGLGWDGMDTIQLQDFWPGNGAISHVSLLNGGTSAPVPEPATMLLFGLGLLGIAGVSRRKK
ncbi:MAG: PEP-CTERM sorting domain-containing protein [Deltaproteobacteria bacterium]|nr:PEP-CTERM sorting domain-containing protein [Candidatus Desulfobacula maris]